MSFHKNWEASEGGESRTEFYRTWRTKLGLGAVGDIDQIEYRFSRTGELVPVAVIEIGVADYGPPPGLLDPANSNSFPSRLGKNRPQGRLLRLVAERLDVCFYGVLLLKDQVEEFHVWNFTRDRNMIMTRRQYEGWLHQLGDGVAL